MTTTHSIVLDPSGIDPVLNLLQIVIHREGAQPHDAQTSPVDGHPSGIAPLHHLGLHLHRGFAPEGIEFETVRFEVFKNLFFWYFIELCS